MPLHRMPEHPACSLIRLGHAVEEIAGSFRLIPAKAQISLRRDIQSMQPETNDLRRSQVFRYAIASGEMRFIERVI